MKIINLESINGGYSGFCTKEFKKYQKFRITAASHMVVPLRVSDKIASYRDFLDVWREVDSSTKFLDRPVEVNELTLDSLKRAEQRLAVYLI